MINVSFHVFDILSEFRVEICNSVDIKFYYFFLN